MSDVHLWPRIKESSLPSKNRVQGFCRSYLLGGFLLVPRFFSSTIRIICSVIVNHCSLVFIASLGLLLCSLRVPFRWRFTFIAVWMLLRFECPGSHIFLFYFYQLQVDSRNYGVVIGSNVRSWMYLCPLYTRFKTFIDYDTIYLISHYLVVIIL